MKTVRSVFNILAPDPSGPCMLNTDRTVFILHIFFFAVSAQLLRIAVVHLFVLLPTEIRKRYADLSLVLHPLDGMTSGATILPDKSVAPENPLLILQIQLASICRS